MPVKRRRPWVDWFVYLGVRTFVALIQALPMSIALGCADGLAWLAYRVDRRHRKVAQENLAHAFPQKSEAERTQIVRNCYRHFSRMIVEIGVLPRKMRVENWRNYASIVGGQHVLTELLKPRPVLIVTGHYGNWELAGFALGLFGFRSYAIARVLDNPHLERFLKQFRQRTGQTLIAKKHDFERLNESLKLGGKVATLGDQDAGSRGVFVNFFNKPASAHKAVALMAMEYDALLLVVGTARVREGEDWHYHILCEDVIDPSEYGTDPNAIRNITQRYHDALARLVEKHPEQYFWLHRRWKTVPPVRGKKSATPSQ
jgi:Kdo2-lipid IVA lauroyltransferase/acyltransferase